MSGRDQLRAQQQRSAEEQRASRDKGSENGERERPSQAQKVLDLALAQGVQPWATPSEDGYITIPVRDHHEHHKLGSHAACDWLAKLHYQEEGKPPSRQALLDAMGVLRGKALWDSGERHEVYVRHAAHGGAIYLDLADTDWRMAKITPEGWSIVREAPVRFRRPRGLSPLPEPVRGGSFNLLRGLLNVDDEAWTLVVGWLVGAMAPTGPYPVLALSGEQGAAKSSAARYLRSLVDPNVAPLRSGPREERDLMIAATNGHVVVLDNISRLPDALSDALCRLATGGGLSTRELYSDSEELILDAVRPVIFTGIAEVATRGDLVDRSIAVTLKPISERDRMSETDLQTRWQEIQPGVLGALFDATVCALRRLRDVRLEKLPRMADHACWVTAAAPALGWSEHHYLAVYGRAREQSVQSTLDSSLIAGPLQKVGDFDGTATELLALLGGHAEESITKQREWPKTAAALGSELRRLAPSLREAGIEIEFDRNARPRKVVIRTGGRNADGAVGRGGTGQNTDGTDSIRQHADGVATAKSPYATASDGTDSKLQGLSNGQGDEPEPAPAWAEEAAADQ